MKQGKRKNAAAETSAPSDDAAPALPDAAYVDQLLAGNASAAPIEAVAADASAEATSVIDLPAQCLLRDAVEYQQRLLKCVGVASVEINVGAVQRIDTAFVQVLLAFVRSCSEANQSIVWRHVNPIFAEAVGLLGLQAALAVPDVSEAA